MSDDEQIKDTENIEDTPETTETPEEANAKAAAAAAEEVLKEEASEKKSDEVSEDPKEDLEKEIEKRDETIGLLHEQLQRQMAEFDNFRKRTQKEKSEMFDMGATDILKKLLPIVDNFERGFNTIPEGEEKTQFAIGMDMVYKQMVKMLEDCKVTPIEALGKEFDPVFHNAVSHVEKDDVGENIIVEEYEKGYMYGDTVLRHSMVIVAN